MTCFEILVKWYPLYVSLINIYWCNSLKIYLEALSMFLSALLIPEFSDHQDCSAGCGAQHVAQIVGEAPCLAHDHKNLQWFALAQIISWLLVLWLTQLKRAQMAHSLSSQRWKKLSFLRVHVRTLCKTHSFLTLSPWQSCRAAPLLDVRSVLSSADHYYHLTCTFQKI